MAGLKGLVVVGASAGGVEALRTFAAGLPAGLEAAVCVVLHVPRSGISTLPHILNRSGPLPAAHAAEGCALEAGRIYVAPPNFHVLVNDGRLRLSRGPAENGHRPAADPLFRSAARSWGSSVVGVVLSGSRDDGASGLATIARHGGLTLVQDPEEALYRSMPLQAMELVPAARVVPCRQMGPVLGGLIADMTGPVPVAAVDDARVDVEDAMATMEDLTADEAGGVPAGLACPDCHGALFELPGERATGFRCRVGHAWTAAALLDEQGEALEGALWMALRSLEEKAALSRRMAESAQFRGSLSTAVRYSEVSADAEAAGRIIRKLIEQLGDLDDKTRVADAP
ncbi:chemotaxis protein CheB [Dactylosporangium fulvum]|uniref:protein-glutamate methylesterase n=1 Tax=Dactylosporangium fulvum TaxID=53359 RepID=A0ABY5VSV4_9ACTN|nr:chemotaxis protein CheB [Dactylosporangium fulvum]UWP80837.1 chemotaxis protein CheB [Dactylosporangium fulvum]